MHTYLLSLLRHLQSMRALDNKLKLEYGVSVIPEL